MSRLPHFNGMKAKTEIPLIPIGSKVVMSGHIECTVIGILIRGEAHSVQYEVVWYDGEQRHTAYIECFEVTPQSDHRLIGYISRQNV